MISHIHRGLEVLERAPDQHEVPSLGATFPDEASAHRAIDAELERWLAAYDKKVDAAH